MGVARKYRGGGDDCAWQGNNQISPMRKMELQQRGRWRNFVTHRDYGLLMGTQMMHFEWGGLQLKRKREKKSESAICKHQD